MLPSCALLVPASAVPALAAPASAVPVLAVPVSAVPALLTVPLTTAPDLWFLLPAELSFLPAMWYLPRLTTVSASWL